MTWTAAEMPDDALISSPEIPDSSSDTTEPQATVEPLPLWRVMHAAYHEGMRAPGEHCSYGMAAEIEAVRDRIAPNAPPLTSDSAPDCPIWARWDERRKIRALLTKEAAIARGEVP